MSKPRIVEALNNLSSDPIAQLLNTHWQTDHTDGNAWVHAAGAKITAHVNTKKHLSTPTRVEGWNWTFPPAPAGAVPSDVFNDEHRLHHNDTNIALTYYGPAHTIAMSPSPLQKPTSFTSVIHGGTVSTHSSITRPAAASMG